MDLDKAREKGVEAVRLLDSVKEFIDEVHKKQYSELKKQSKDKNMPLSRLIESKLV